MVSSSICGSCAAQSACMLAVTPSLGEPRHVVGVHDLQVGDVVPAVGWAVGRARRLDRVEASRTARSPMAWKCTWKPSASSARDVLLEAAPGRRSRGPVVVGLAAVAVQVRLEHRGREVLGHAVLHDLDAGRPEPAGAAAGPRRSTRSSIWSAPRVRSHHSAPTAPAGELAGRAAAAR